MKKQHWVNKPQSFTTMWNRKWTFSAAFHRIWSSREEHRFWNQSARLKACRELSGSPPKIHLHQISGACKCYPFQKKDFADGVKNPDMRSFWIIWVGPKNNDWCSCKRKTEIWDRRGAKIHGRASEGHSLWSHKPKDAQSHLKQEEARKDSSLEPLKGSYNTPGIL